MLTDSCFVVLFLVSSCLGHVCKFLDHETGEVSDKQCETSELERCTYAIIQFQGKREISQRNCAQKNCDLISDDKYCKLGCRDIEDSSSGLTFEWCVCEGDNCNDLPTFLNAESAAQRNSITSASVMISMMLLSLSSRSFL